jgi:phosphate transport system substrate-binding protein
VRLRIVMWMSLLAAVAAFTAAATAAASLSGTGSALVAPLETKWATAFAQADGATVKYTASGTAIGIAAATSGTVDFGASDAPLTTAQTAFCHGCFQLPWALSAIGIGYNVPGIGRKLHLTGAVLAAIYSGQISRWNDARIRALNPHLRLPQLAIIPIYAGNGSGDTYVFTTYLSRISGSWRSHVGSGLSVTFPAGTPAGSLTAATALLESKAGAVAYLPVTYLINTGMPAAAIQNSAGNFEFPNLSNIASAAGAVRTVPASGAIDLIAAAHAARDAYPISTYTYVIVPANPQNKVLLRQWILFAIGPGQKYASALDFVPLPAAVVSAGQSTLNRLSG